VRRGLKIHLVEHVNEVFEHALLWRRAGAKRTGRATHAEGLNPRTKLAAQAPKRNGSSLGRRAQ
jgi:hypothetical protein